MGQLLKALALELSESVFAGISVYHPMFGMLLAIGMERLFDVFDIGIWQA